MVNTKQMRRKHSLPPNPFRKGLELLNHPTAWIVELILTEVFTLVENNLEDKENQRPDEGLRALSRACSKSKMGDALKNILDEVVDVGKIMHAQDKDKIEYLKDKIKLNIENYRERMVRRKQMRSYKDAHGQLPAG